VATACDVTHAHDADRAAWDGYVTNHAQGSLFHLFGWSDAIRGAYGHSIHYLLARAREADRAIEARRIVGVLPLVNLRHAIFGNALVSLPFLDGGGILADDVETERDLLTSAVRLGIQAGAGSIDLRQERPLAMGDTESASGLRLQGSPLPIRIASRSHKVRMLLTLPGSPELLLNSFKSKLRSQINKARKEGFDTRVGGLELLEDFYKVFLVNMRDLGSPVHSKKLMQHCLTEFAKHARIIAVYRSAEPVAAAIVIGFKSVLSNPWASSLRKYASLGPNMLLYLRMLEYACDRGYAVFDFGRSSPGEGTYRFKEQWGAVPQPLYWHYISLDGRAPNPDVARSTGMQTAAQCWRRLPLSVTRIIGPRIRKHISL